MEFKIGDRIVTKSDMGRGIKKGMTGTVIDKAYGIICIEFDKDKACYCWYLESDDIEKLDKGE